MKNEEYELDLLIWKNSTRKFKQSNVIPILHSSFFILHFMCSAQIINLLTNEIHSRKSARKSAILAHSATLWLSKHCKTGEKMTVFFRPKSTENRPKSIDIER